MKVGRPRRPSNSWAHEQWFLIAGGRSRYGRGARVIVLEVGEMDCGCDVWHSLLTNVGRDKERVATDRSDQMAEPETDSCVIRRVKG